MTTRATGSGSIASIGIVRRVVVSDASDIASESAFWAGMLDGRVVVDDRFHSVVDAEARSVMGVQWAPDHVPPGWPDGNPQQVYADPAGHPFCIGWVIPTTTPSGRSCTARSTRSALAPRSYDVRPRAPAVASDVPASSA